MELGIALALSLIVAVHAWSAIEGLVLLTLATTGRRAPRAVVGSGPRPRVCVLVPCFNERTVLRRTLESIVGSRDVDIAQIICIDDGSTDGTVGVMWDAHRRYGSLITILSQPNSGKAAALNYGLREVNTETFVAVDADTQILPHAIASLLAHFADQDVGAVSGHMLVGNLAPASGAVCAAQTREYERANNIDRRAFSTLERITIVPGAIGAFRSGAVERAGGYPEGSLAEDAHLTLLLLLGGYKVVHEPAATVLTEAPDSLAGLFRQRVRWATGKTDVILRTARAALGQRGAMSAVWLHMAFHQLVLPLFALVTAAISPVLVVAALLWGTGPSVAVLAATAVAVTVVDVVQFWVSARFARALDVRVRAAAGLTDRPAGILAALIIPAVSFVAAWLAWYRVVTGARMQWNKLARTGDVSVPGLGAPSPAPWRADEHPASSGRR
jgi:cellulose synthase/poly-beta-1,6-N-acetylglucosamine synthase-like glycosyltransferase